MVINGKVAPGWAQVKFSRGRKLDKKHSPGEDGGLTANKGYQLGRGQIVIRMTERDELEAWPDLAAQLAPPAGGQSYPVGCIHPKLALMGVQSVYVEKMSSLDEEGGNPGVYAVTLDIVEEVAKPKKAKEKLPKTSGLASAPAAPYLLPNIQPAIGAASVSIARVLAQVPAAVAALANGQLTAALNRPNPALLPSQTQAQRRP